MTNDSDSSADSRAWLASRRSFLTLAGLAVGGVVVGVSAAGCGTAQTGNSRAARRPRVAPAPPARPCSSPASSGARRRASTRSPRRPTGRPRSGQSQLIYESLLRFNMLDGSLHPGLAKELQQPDDSTLRAAAAGRHQVVRRLRAHRRRRRLHLRARQGPPRSTSPTVWQYIDSVTATDPRTVTVQAQDQAVQPRLRQELHASSARSCPRRSSSKIAPDKIAGRAQPQAGRLRPVQARQVRPDPGQPEAERHLLGQGGLRHPADDHDQPPDLQEQQRRRPQAGERRDRREPAVHRADLEDVGGQGQAGRHLDEEEALPPAGQPAAADLQPEQEGPGQRQGPAGHRLRDQLPQHRHHGHVGLLRAGQRQPDRADRLRVEVLRRGAGRVRGLEVRQGQGDRHPRERAEGQEGLGRHLRAAGRHQAGRLEADHPDRLDRLEHRLRDRGQVGQGGRHRHHHRVPAVPDHVRRRCRTATSTWPCTPTPASTRPARGSGSATPWTTAACPAVGKTAFWNYNRFNERRGRRPCSTPRPAPRPTPRPRRRTPRSTRSTGRTSR